MHRLVGAGAATPATAQPVVRGAPEAERFNARMLRYIGDNAYCLYLSHLTVLGLMHGLILGRRPDLQTPAQWAVTLTALPVCLVVGRLMTRYIEEPFMAFGRRWRWGAERTGQQRGPFREQGWATNDGSASGVSLRAVYRAFLGGSPGSVASHSNTAVSSAIRMSE